jgi:HlyD family secretion protein
MKRAILLLPPLLLLVSACSEKKEEAEGQAAAPVQVATAARETMRRVVTADGVIFPVDQTNVMSKISAPVRVFYIKRGQHVKAGQLIATLENRDLVAAVAAARAQLAQAQSNLVMIQASTVPEAVTKAQADLQSAREQLDAAQKLLESRRKLFQEGALARRLVDEAQVAYAQAKAQFETAQEHLKSMQSVANHEQIATARAQVEAARAGLAAAEAQVGYSEIRTPISGLVADRPLYPGDIASTGQPIATIVDISRVVARTNVPQTEAGLLKVGNPATVKLTAGELEIDGKVTVVSPATDPSSTTVQVWVQSADPAERFKPGMSVRVEILARTIPDATVVPTAALLSGPEGGITIITVSADHKAHVNTVTVGARQNGKVQILSGIAPGDQVVVTGGLGLEDGASVRIVEPAKQ